MMAFKFAAGSCEERLWKMRTCASIVIHGRKDAGHQSTRKTGLVLHYDEPRFDQVLQNSLLVLLREVSAVLDAGARIRNRIMSLFSQPRITDLRCLTLQEPVRALDYQ